MTTHIVLPGKERAQLDVALSHYRKAVNDLEEAILAEAWGAIHSLQSRRDLQAHTIALIVSGCAQSIVQVGVAA